MGHRLRCYLSGSWLCLHTYDSTLPRSGGHRSSRGRLCLPWLVLRLVLRLQRRLLLLPIVRAWSSVRVCMARPLAPAGSTRRSHHLPTAEPVIKSVPLTATPTAAATATATATAYTSVWARRPGLLLLLVLVLRLLYTRNPLLV